MSPGGFAASGQADPPWPAGGGRVRSGKPGAEAPPHGPSWTGAR